MSIIRPLIPLSLLVLLGALASGCGSGAAGDAVGTIEDAGISEPDTGTADGGDRDGGGAEEGRAVDVPPGDASGPEDTFSPEDGADSDGADLPSDTADAGLDCPGGAGCDCAQNSECDNGICLDTAGGRKCATKCVDTCEPGYTCKPFGTSDTTLVCVPDLVTLCAPCESNQDCKVQGSQALCLDYGPAGHFCGGLCKEDGDCPKGYGCVDVVDPDTKKLSKQCRLADPQASCTCSVWAKAAATKTACALSNEAGTCPGTRYCGKGGLSACDAPTPATETCDGIDNDCDGTTDTGVCEDDDACTADHCKVKDGTCEHVQLADCHDGDHCNTDACNPKTGQCEHGAGPDCNDQNGCTKDSCEPTTGDCLHQLDTGASCDDGDACTDGDVCAELGGKAGCKPGQAKPCDDGNLCTDDSCDPGKGCVQAPNAVTQSCYDGLVGTAGRGTCAAGSRQCSGGVLLAACKGAVLPVKTEACDGKDDDCDGQTDEICGATAAEIGFATAGGTVGGTKGGARLLIGAESAAGRVKGAKRRTDFGLLPWLLGHLLD